MREWEKREGFRDAQLGEYMWEQEFYEVAGAAKMGFLSKAESQKQWQEMEAASWRPRDHEGPRGFLRLWIKTKDQAEFYNDVSSAKRLQIQEASKKVDEKHVQDRLQAAFGDTVDDRLDFNLDFDAVEAEAMKASGTGARMEGVMNPLLGDMMAAAALQVSAKSKGRTARALAAVSRRSQTLTRTKRRVGQRVMMVMRIPRAAIARRRRPRQAILPKAKEEAKARAAGTMQRPRT